MYYQPMILMAIANEISKSLGPVFLRERRIGDWSIVERSLLDWSKDMRGFALRGFCKIFEENGFGEYERKRLRSFFPRTRADAARRLGRMLYTPAIPDLLRSMNESSRAVREAASWSLAKMGQSPAARAQVTSSEPQDVSGAVPGLGGSVSGRFFWDDGKPIVIEERQQTAYLLRQPGGMAASVENVAVRRADGKVTAATRRFTYRDGYRLDGMNPRYPMTLKATLKQCVEDYYVILESRRSGVQVKHSCVTMNVDFVFPRLSGPEDRVSMRGHLLYPEKFPDGYRRQDAPGASVVLQAEDGRRIEYLSYQEVRSYRLHEVPPGKYVLQAKYGPFSCRGTLTVPEQQPYERNLQLKPGL